MIAASYAAIQNETATPQLLVPRACQLLGYSLVEFTGVGDVEVDFFDGPGPAFVGANYIGSFNASANESEREWWGPGGILLPQGLLINILAGQAKGVFFYV